MSQPDPALLVDLERLAVRLAEEAGQLLRERYRGALNVEFKGKDRRDPVTEADRAIEQHIREAVGRAFPDHVVIGEEVETAESGADFVWAVDPIDGTANFIDGLPAFGSSIAVLHRGVPVVGAIYLPFGPDLRAGVLHARRGGSAFFGDEAVSVMAGGGGSRLCTLPPAFRWQFQAVRGFGREVGEVRSLGSITYELALVAAGVLRFAVFAGPKLWDVAAGAVIVPEAGGLFCRWDGRAWTALTVFEPQATRPKPGERRRNPAPGSLRAWSAPVLAGHPDAVRALSATMRPRGGWLLGVVRFLRRLRRGSAA